MLLYIGDVHIKNTNVVKITTLIENIQKSEIELQAIIIGGDLLHYHEKVNTYDVNMAIKLMETCGAKATTYVLVGNHDYVDNNQFLSDLHWMNKLKISRVIIVDKPKKMIFESGEFHVLIPYVQSGRMVEALNKIPDWKEAQCVWAHQEIAGCKMNAITSNCDDEWKPNWPQLISGHIHEFQQWDNVFYPGSCINHSTGHSQGLVWIEFKDDEMEWTRSSLGLAEKFNKLIVTNKAETIKLKKSTKQVEFRGTLNEFLEFKKSSCFKQLVDAGVECKFKQTKSTIVKDFFQEMEKIVPSHLREKWNAIKK